MQISACQPCDLHGTTNSLDLSPWRGISARDPAAARFETIASNQDQHMLTCRFKEPQTQSCQGGCLTAPQ